MVVCVVNTQIQGGSGDGKAGATQMVSRASPMEQEKKFMRPRQVDNTRPEQIIWKYYDSNVQARNA